jgi:hypothetical protein
MGLRRIDVESTICRGFRREVKPPLPARSLAQAICESGWRRTKQITHEFAEWAKNYPDPEENTSRVIPLHDVLDAVGLGEKKAAILAEIQEEAREERGFRRLLARTGD